MSESSTVLPFRLTEGPVFDYGPPKASAQIIDLRECLQREVVQHALPPTTEMPPLMTKEATAFLSSEFGLRDFLRLPQKIHKFLFE